MMRIITSVLALGSMLFVADLHALRSPENKEAEPEHPVASTQRKAQDAERKKKSQPVRTFTPSEKIEADSAVSFPVDI